MKSFRCNLCPRNCNADRLNGQLGYCRAGQPEIASFCIHKGEEPSISGENGSGAIFFSHCTLSCKFCQNYPISQYGIGKAISIERLSEIMLILQKRGAGNINLVTADQYIPWIIHAVRSARADGLHIPILFNTSSFLNVEALEKLDGIVDIFLADFKYFDEAAAAFLCNTFSYPTYAKKAIQKMYELVGAVDTESSAATRGLIIRHLVIPGFIDQSYKILDWIKKTFGSQVTVSVMGQYFPAYKAVEISKIGRKLNRKEYMRVVQKAKRLQFSGWIQNENCDINRDENFINYGREL